MARPKVIRKEPDLHCNSIITHDCRKTGAACRFLQISKPTLCKTILSSSFVLESRTETDKLVFSSLWAHFQNPGKNSEHFTCRPIAASVSSMTGLVNDQLKQLA